MLGSPRCGQCHNEPEEQSFTKHLTNIVHYGMMLTFAVLWSA